MLRNVLAFGLGAVVGVVAIGVVAYCIYKKNKDTVTTNETEAEKEFAEKLKKTEENEKQLNEFIKNQSYVDILTSKELSEWFRNNWDKYDSEVKMIILKPIKETIMNLGYPLTDKINPDKNIIQMFYDTQAKKVLDIRLISFENIESNLQAHLIEEDGLIVVTD